jgi:hypothetical protein
MQTDEQFSGERMLPSLYIQGDSWGKVSILGDDSIGHWEKKSSYEHVSDSEWLPR